MNEPTLRVTGCRVYPNPVPDEHLKGFASIVLNEVFAVCDLKIIQGNNKLFVAMPSRRRRDGTFHDVAHPICQNLRDHIERVVLEAFQKHVDSAAPADGTSSLSEPTRI
jgi:stage V sporulation protein G